MKNKLEGVTAWVTELEQQAIKLLAKKNGRSVSSELRTLILVHLQNNGISILNGTIRTEDVRTN